MALRRKRIDRPRAERFLEELAALSIAVEPALTLEQVKVVFALSIQHDLTFYDATYLDLAYRSALPLASLDEALLRASRAIGVSMVR